MNLKPVTSTLQTKPMVQTQKFHILFKIFFTKLKNITNQHLKYQN